MVSPSSQLLEAGCPFAAFLSHPSACASELTHVFKVVPSLKDIESPKLYLLLVQLGQNGLDSDNRYEMRALIPMDFGWEAAGQMAGPCSRTIGSRTGMLRTIG